MSIVTAQRLECQELAGNGEIALLNGAWDSVTGHTTLPEREGKTQTGGRCGRDRQVYLVKADEPRGEPGKVGLPGCPLDEGRDRGLRHLEVALVDHQAQAGAENHHH